MTHSPNPIHLEEVLKITNNNLELAKEMVAMLGTELPSFKSTINQAYEQKNFSELQTQAHKLHGACCYCGVHNLRQHSADLETLLKAKQHHMLTTKIDALNREIDTILQFMQEQKLIS